MVPLDMKATPTAVVANRNNKQRQLTGDKGLTAEGESIKQKRVK